MKIILIVIDGLGDKPITALKNKTPLEAARTPNLDWLAKNGISGLVLPFLKERKLPTSEDTHLALFGYNPLTDNPGRGVLEALGIGLKVLPADVCLRGNFATVDNKTLKIIDRRAGRIKETKNLIKAISGIEIEGIKFLIGRAASHRIGIVMRGRGISSKISDGDPKVNGVKPRVIRPLNKSKEAEFTSMVLNQFLQKSHLILKNHPLNKKRKLPANYILTRGAGSLKKIKGLKEKYGLKPVCIAGGALYKGIGKYLGMDLINVKGANGLPTTNLKGKILVAKSALKRYNFIFCHIKAADNLAEDGNYKGKKEFIEKIDKNLKALVNLKNILIVVTGDHSTCSLLKNHCKNPIPILIYGKDKDGIQRFCEKECSKGALDKVRQIDLLKKILESVNMEI